MQVRVLPGSLFSLFDKTIMRVLRMIDRPHHKMDTLRFEPRAFRMRSGCDTTTPCALEKQRRNTTWTQSSFLFGSRPKSKRNENAETRDRTGDLQIFSLTLSQLSYRGFALNPKPKRFRHPLSFANNFSFLTSFSHLFNICACSHQISVR